MRILLFVSVSCLTLSISAFGMGSKKLSTAELLGVTESQMARAPEGKSLAVMLRGRGAEVLYKKIQEKRVEQKESEALAWVGKEKAMHWTVKGDQVTCSRIQNIKTKADDYACAFELNAGGKVAASKEAFNPNLFNLKRTKTQAKLFKKNGRGLASLNGPQDTKAYLMYSDPNNKAESHDALFVFRGEGASEIMSFLQENKEQKNFIIAGIKGMKGKEISCVQATDAEPARCALVIDLRDGEVSTRKNPLL